ncbi:Imm74 family immunity protein [Methylocapsa polymorpha]|uniref:Imm74 family immunity protein n=1 Tax=Methylocapsa polymorpha TaxID=3080828 RepID=A0ABZ0HNJ8_9HYPH|nr:Imm74 family immunity protein [Methylocapsa sp. RX1]
MTRRRGAEPQITLTEGSIRVLWGDKVLTIPHAPGLPDAKDQADFIVDLDAILSWDAPNDANAIEVAELQKIVQAIETEFERLGLVVEFE